MHVRSWARIAAVTTLAGAAACLSRPSPEGSQDGGSTSSDGGRSVGDTGAAAMKYMFVSAEVFVYPWANTSPESGSADASCTEFASGTAHPGLYMAWLSYGDGIGNNAADRLRAAPNAREWHLFDGTLFAHTVQDIVGLNIANAPKIDENGQDVTLAGVPPQVATGTAVDGTYDGGTSADCPSGKIEIGSADQTSSAWTDAGYTLCSAMNLRLYCFGYGP